MSSLRRSNTFEAFQDGPFARLWVSFCLSYVCRAIETTALPWLLLELTDSPGLVTALGAVRTAPLILVGLLAGGLVDRYSKKWVLVGSHLFSLAAALLVLVMLWTRAMRIWVIFLAAVLSGIAYAADFSSKRAYISQRFSGSRLSNALSLEYVAFTVTNILGPLIGGSMPEMIGYLRTFVLVVALDLVDLVLLVSLAPDKASAVKAATSRGAANVVRSMRAVWSNRPVRAVILVTGMLNLFAYPNMQLLPVLARDVLGVGSVLHGVLRSATGVGSLIGSLVLASLRVQRKQAMLALGCTLMLVGWLGTGISSVYVPSFLLLCVVGLGMAGFSTTQPTIIVQSAPGELQGLALGALAGAIGISPLGALWVGQLAEARGAQAAIQLQALVGLACLGVLIWTQLDVQKETP